MSWPIYIYTQNVYTYILFALHLHMYNDLDDDSCDERMKKKKINKRDNGEENLLELPHFTSVMATIYYIHTPRHTL